MRTPPDAGIYAPEFPPRLDWLNVAFLRMDKLLGRHAVLIEFWDFARVNSLRTMPYLKAWHERYVAGETLARAVVYDGASGDGAAATIEGRPLTIRVNRVSP